MKKIFSGAAALLAAVILGGFLGCRIQAAEGSYFNPEKANGHLREEEQESGEGEDERKPALEARILPEGYVADRVVILLLAADEGSGLAGRPYSYDGGETWTVDSMHEVTENGVYEAAVRDRAGNVAEITVTVENIDRQPPSVTLRLFPRSVEGGAARLTVLAEDEGAGLAAKAYSFDGGKTYQASSGYWLSEPGEVHVVVRDALGNMASVHYRAEWGNAGTGREHIAGTGSEHEAGTGNETESGTESRAENGTESGAEALPETEQSPPEEEAWTAAGEAAESAKIMEQYLAENVQEPLQELSGKSGSGWPLFTEFLLREIVPLWPALLPFLLAEGVACVWYFIYARVRILNYDGSRDYRYSGSAALYRRKGFYRVRLRKRMEEKAVTDVYRICPARLFVRLHRGKGFLAENAAGSQRAELPVAGQMDCILNGRTDRVWRACEVVRGGSAGGA